MYRGGGFDNGVVVLCRIHIIIHVLSIGVNTSGWLFNRTVDSLTTAANHHYDSMIMDTWWSVMLTALVMDLLCVCVRVCCSPFLLRTYRIVSCQCGSGCPSYRFGLYQY